MRGMQVHELGEALHALAVEADKDGPLGLKPDVASWPHVKLHPLTFDGLALARRHAQRRRCPGLRQRPTERICGLAWPGPRWPLTGPRRRLRSSEPSVVAKAIDENSGRAEAYDQVIVGYLLQIARELKTATGEKADELKRQTSTAHCLAQARHAATAGGDGRRSGTARTVRAGRDARTWRWTPCSRSSRRPPTPAARPSRMAWSECSPSWPRTPSVDPSIPRGRAPTWSCVNRSAGCSRTGGSKIPNPEAYGRVLEHLATSVQRRCAAVRLGGAQPNRIRFAWSR